MTRKQSVMVLVISLMTLMFVLCSCDEQRSLLDSDPNTDTEKGVKEVTPEYVRHEDSNSAENLFETEPVVDNSDLFGIELAGEQPCDGEKGTGTYCDCVSSGTPRSQGFFVDSATSGDAYVQFREAGSAKWVIYNNGDIGSDDRLQILKYNPTLAVMTFLKNGDVGIGTVAPISDLHVNGSSTLGSAAITPSESVSGDDSEFLMCEDDDCTMGMSFFYDGGEDRLKIRGKYSSTYYPLMTFLRSGGRVGILTDNPTHALTVKGTIKSEEIIVADVSADYVFEDGYNLMSLSEVEQFIEKNNHLPSIPSAADAQANGTSLGKRQTLLLSKIEELTLYLIAQNKEITALKKKVSELGNSE